MKPSIGLLIGGALIFACATVYAQPPPGEPQVPSAAQRVPNPRVDAPDGAVSGEPANEALPGDRPVPPLPGNPADRPLSGAAGIPGNPPGPGPVNPAGPPPVNPAGPAPRNAPGPPPMGAPGAGGSR